jgi:hypothetical protein
MISPGVCSPTPACRFTELVTGPLPSAAPIDPAEMPADRTRRAGVYNKDLSVSSLVLVGVTRLHRQYPVDIAQAGELSH